MAGQTELGLILLLMKEEHMDGIRKYFTLFQNQDIYKHGVLLFETQQKTMEQYGLHQGVRKKE